MGQAELIKKMEEGFSGDARLYQVSPPLQGYRYVIVSAANTMGGPGETFIFPATADGKILSWGELPGSISGEMNHARALREAGYKIV